MSVRLLPQLLPRRYILSFRTVYSHGRTLRLHRRNSVDSGDKFPLARNNVIQISDQKEHKCESDKFRAASGCNTGHMRRSHANQLFSPAHSVPPSRFSVLLHQNI